MEMKNFWESKFKDEQTLWGFEPSESALQAKDFFLGKNIKNILIPGFGYGRNAKVFIDSGIKVTGIEISQTAIDLARAESKLDVEIYHGSVTDMPFDDRKYDGIFCYAVIHLLNKPQRKRFLERCYSQLKTGGYMVFSVVSKKTGMYGKGKPLSEDRFEMMDGLRVFFYDSESVKKEFNDFGLMDFVEVDEPIKHMKNETPLKLFLVKCRKMDKYA